MDQPSTTCIVGAASAMPRLRRRSGLWHLWLAAALCACSTKPGGADSSPAPDGPTTLGRCEIIELDEKYSCPYHEVSPDHDFVFTKLTGGAAAIYAGSFHDEVRSEAPVVAAPDTWRLAVATLSLPAPPDPWLAQFNAYFHRASTPAKPQLLVTEGPEGILYRAPDAARLVAIDMGGGGYPISR
jgi:hypothetical protein